MIGVLLSETVYAAELPSVTLAGPAMLTNVGSTSSRIVPVPVALVLNVVPPTLVATREYVSLLSVKGSSMIGVRT